MKELRRCLKERIPASQSLEQVNYKNAYYFIDYQTIGRVR